MQRRFFLALGLLLAAPLFAHANSISLQGTGQLLENTPGQVVTLLLSGTDEYSSSDLFMQINGGVGPAPFVTAVFGDTGGSIANPALFAGSIWAGGLAGILSDPNGTSPTSSGLVPGAGFATGSFFPSSANGIYAQFTISTVGVPGGTYPLTFAGSIMTWKDPDGNVDDQPVDLTFAPLSLTVPGPAVPEPSSIVLGLFAAAGLGAVVVRRRRRTA